MSFVKSILLGGAFLILVQLKLNAQQYGALGGSGSYSRPVIIKQKTLYKSAIKMLIPLPFFINCTIAMSYLN